MELTKEERISKELERMSFYFEDIAENQRAIIAPLIQNAAFMKVTLDDIQAEINSDGITDIYQNGENQKGRKTSANLQSYNSLIKNYGGIMKLLSGMLPKEVRGRKLEELMKAQEG